MLMIIPDQRKSGHNRRFTQPGVPELEIPG